MIQGFQDVDEVHQSRSAVQPTGAAQVTATCFRVLIVHCDSSRLTHTTLHVSATFTLPSSVLITSSLSSILRTYLAKFARNSLHPFFRHHRLRLCLAWDPAVDRWWRLARHGHDPCPSGRSARPWRWPSNLHPLALGRLCGQSPPPWSRSSCGYSVGPPSLKQHYVSFGCPHRGLLGNE